VNKAKERLHGEAAPFMMVAWIMIVENFMLCDNTGGGKIVSCIPMGC
jgi:hypothetical protein